MSAEIVKHTTPAASLPDMIRYAEHLADANLLPAQYRQKPSNVLYAMEYGRTLGITPLAAITGIHVIEGKPSASAALISGLVRQAGHKLRVRVENGPGGPRAIATIHRADDPEFEFRSEWDMDRARAAGLVNKDVWRRYPQAMLKARAITEVAREACEEVLFGLHYTPEELDATVDEDGVPVDAPVQPLRRVQPTEADPWAAPQPQPKGTLVVDPECIVTHPEGQAIVDAAAKATHRGAVKERWAEAKDAELLHAVVKAPDTGGWEMVREYLTRLGKALPEAAPAAPAPSGDDQPSDEGVTDAEVVADGETEADAAERELRAAAAKAGLDNLDAEFEQSYGLPIAQAGAAQLRQMTAILTGSAA